MAQSNKTNTLMPVLFSCHGGGPTGLIDAPADARAAIYAEFSRTSEQVKFNKEQVPKILKSHLSHLPDGKPTAIVLISAHWISTDGKIHVAGKDAFTHHFDDFSLRMPDGKLPNEVLAKCMYDAKIDVKLARQIVETLENNGIPAVLNTERGIDQGVFIPLQQIFPLADIPIVSMSILSSYDAATHHRMGELLRSLRAHGVLVIGSGSVTHDLTRTSTAHEAHAFVHALKAVLAPKGEEEKKREVMRNWEKELPFANRCHPDPDHMMPLIVAAGCAGGSKGVVLNDVFIWAGTRSAASFLFVDE